MKFVHRKTRLSAIFQRRLCPYYPQIRLALKLLLVFLLFLLTLKLFTPLITSFLQKLKQAQRITQSFFSQSEAILHSTQERTNILLLGMGGAGHEAPELTDSLIFLSVNLDSLDTVMISIPRDFWVNSLKAKINSAYYYGEQTKAGGGLILAKAAVEEIFGQPIHYSLALDFYGFEKAIDLVGGIDLVVDRTFDDYQYPIPGQENAWPESKRYQHLHFDQGLQHFDGATALQFVRSRNAAGEEGSDFARSQRQQKVILAFKDKVLSLAILTNPKKIQLLLSTLSDSISTDLTEAEFIALSKIALNFDQQKLRFGTLDTGDQSAHQPGLLVNPPLSQFGQWVLIPADRTGNQIKLYVKQLLYQN